jgi:probable rRNA maturation factor
VLEVEVIGDGGPQAPSRAEVERVIGIAFASAGVHEGHVAIEYVAAERIAALNEEFRGRPGPTDVLSFPMDGDEQLPEGVPRQLGDLVVCPAVATADGTPIATLLVHGALHLVGYDHETDDGAMLQRQEQLVREVAPVVADPS